MSARSCDQLFPITADHMALMISQCLLSVSISASCQCSSMPPASAHQYHINATYQCLPVHINATYQCPSELPFSATYQCQSVPPISAASQCHQPTSRQNVPRDT
ncbi:unnamed protein product [Staurois parvus]|uniref:Uncharacterized protein n=1 Tax=Staurois parvus TaxID=386267 RepID=A0ABN9DXY4_9NEOB|nr:unnamed protein product [Staurois parvus]